MMQALHVAVISDLVTAIHTPSPCFVANARIQPTYNARVCSNPPKGEVSLSAVGQGATRNTVHGG